MGGDRPRDEAAQGRLTRVPDLTPYRDRRAAGIESDALRVTVLEALVGGIVKNPNTGFPEAPAQTDAGV